MKPDELPLATLDLRHAGATLAHPCHCGTPGCNLGVHIWRSTRDMAPGPRAQAFEPRTVVASGPPSDSDPPPDPTSLAHHEYNRLLADAQNSARALTAFIARHRPDRWIPDLPPTLSDDDWCKNHLDVFGICEVRYATKDFRSEYCRRCYDVHRLHGVLPDRPLMRAWHEGRRITDNDIADFRKRVGRNTQKRRKAG